MKLDEVFEWGKTANSALLSFCKVLSLCQGSDDFPIDLAFNHTCASGFEVCFKQKGGLDKQQKMQMTYSDFEKVLGSSQK